MKTRVLWLGVIAVLSLAACANSEPVVSAASDTSANYVIGPGDPLGVFVSRHDELSVWVAVRPDGKVSMPLVNDMPAVGKTPSQLAKDIEVALAQYIGSPSVTVTVEPHLPTCHVSNTIARDIRDIDALKEGIDHDRGHEDRFTIGAQKTLDALRLQVLKECSEQQITTR